MSYTHERIFASLTYGTRLTYVPIKGHTKGVTYEIRIGGSYDFNSVKLGELSTGISKGTCMIGGGIFGMRQDIWMTPSKAKTTIKTLRDLITYTTHSNGEIHFARDENGEMWIGNAHNMKHHNPHKSYMSKQLENLTPIEA